MLDAVEPVFQTPPLLLPDKTGGLIVPTQKDKDPELVITDAIGNGLIKILAPLSVPVITGFELTTRIR